MTENTFSIAIIRCHLALDLIDTGGDILSISLRTSTRLVDQRLNL
jgi:hypothetical protein